MQTLNLFSELGAMFLIRWIHFLAGITWIGILYYFNFVQGPFLASVEEAATKKDVTTKLLPRALWWFRWGALVTVLAGLILYYELGARGGNMGAWMGTAQGVTITIGGILGIIMLFNVWVLIWPNQKKIIAAVGEGKAPTGLGGKPRVAFLASRTNTMLSIPMLFLMAASAHMPTWA
ncbi:MAG: urate hydroxylase PuuD [SAR324 cluster bacterium]|nr:urate hydroxylase PuuD [SAR324 cluster bacterium]MCH8888794.1 urate hydroxylase PuuD [SAR324 cluster bacterium]